MKTAVLPTALVTLLSTAAAAHPSELRIGDGISGRVQYWH